MDLPYAELKDICAGVSLGSVLGPVLYMLLMNDVSETFNKTLADDTTITVTVRNVKLNSTRSKCTNIYFTNKKIGKRAIFVN